MVTNYKLLTTHQTAVRLGVSQPYIQKLIRMGAFPNASKIGEAANSPFVIPEKDVLAFVSTWKRRNRKKKAE